MRGTLLSVLARSRRSTSTVPTDVTVKYTVTVKAADGTDTSTPPSYDPGDASQRRPAGQDGELTLTHTGAGAPATPDGDAARPGFTLPEILIVITFSWCCWESECRASAISCAISA